MTYTVSVCFGVESGLTDEALEDIVGKGSGGSGFGFGERDLSWTFKTYPAARKIFDKIRAKRSLKGKLAELRLAIDAV